MIGNSRIQSASISLVIPTYNGTAFLRETLACLAGQTLRPAEVLVVDDRSTDGTPESAEAWGHELGLPLRVIRQAKNSGGPVVPMSAGVEAATSRLIALCDQDDILPPDRLERHVAALVESPSAGLSCGVNVAVDSAGVPTGGYTHSADVWATVPGRSIGGGRRLISAEAAYLSFLREGQSVGGASSMAFPKEVWRALGGFDPSFRVCWDFEFAVRVAAKYDIVYDLEPLSFHRLHAGNLGHRLDLQSAEVDRVRSDNYRRPAVSIPKAERRNALAKISAERAYRLRETGSYLASAKEYVNQFGSGERLAAVKGLSKLALVSILALRTK